MLTYTPLAYTRSPVGAVASVSENKVCQPSYAAFRRSLYYTEWEFKEYLSLDLWKVACVYYPMGERNFHQ